MPKKKKLKLKKKIIFKAIALLVIFMSLWVFVLFLRLQLLPWLYLMLIFCVLGAIDVGLYLLLSKKSSNCRMVGSALALILLAIFSIGITYQNATLSFLQQFSFLNIETEYYQVVVHKNSAFHSLNDLANETIYYVTNREGAQKASQDLAKKGIQKALSKEGVGNLITEFLADEVSVILLEQGEVELYNEMSREFRENHEVLETIRIEIQKEAPKNDVKITQEPFSVYITGSDTYKEINTVARSDVNMIITVNPITHQILLTSIPRDYYVKIAGDTSELNDKLTHAGLKGVNTSIETIENLLEVDIQYYIKFNFTSLIQIVDALGGIDVDSPFAFTADYEEDEHIYYEFQKGINHLDGKQALAYVRERYGLREGDVARARHQQQVVKAVVDKLTTTTILTKYASLLGSMEGNFTTNIDIDSITAFAKMQLEQMPSWTIEMQVLEGSDAQRKTASIPNLYSAVMIPDEESVLTSVQKINELTE